MEISGSFAEEMFTWINVFRAEVKLLRRNCT